MKKHVPSVLVFVFSFCISQKLFAQELSKNDITQICQRVKEKIDSHYVIKAKRKLISNYIDSLWKKGVYFSFLHPDSLRKKLTDDLRRISNDKHLYVEYLKPGHKDSSFDWDGWAKQERIDEVEKNFGYTSLEVMEGNIGYMRIVECMNPDRGMQTVAAALLFLNQTKGLIIDLRGNGGGYGGLLDLILTSYFGEEPVHISTFTTNDSPPNNSYTLPFTFGKRREGSPLCILVDRKTGSAAEFFAYTLQSFKKAIIVGEPSAGAAHMNSYYPLTQNFRISVSTGAPLNPVTKMNWEGTGIIPDISEDPAKAKERAWKSIYMELKKQ